MSGKDRIGRMDQRIVLNKPTQEKDEMGGNETTPVEVGPVWAEIKTPRFQTMEMKGAVVSEATFEIHIRYRNDARRNWTVAHGNRKYKVAHVYHIGRETTVLVVKDVTR